MTLRPSALLALALLLLVPAAPALAQEAPEEGELAGIRATFEFGKYAEVLERAVARIDRGNLDEPSLVELHKLAGLAAFNLGRREEAARHLRALLRLEPDYGLDPFVVPPPAVAYFEELRRELRAELALIRQEKRLRVERERTEAAQRERERMLSEERRRRVEELARQVTVRTVERRSFLVNFVPFGAGQFQQGRNSLGVIFAATEGVFAVSSVLAFFAYEGLFDEVPVEIEDRQSPTGTAKVNVRFIPAAKEQQADAWRLAKYGSAAGFYAMYALGVADALYHHQDEVVRTGIETLPDAPAAARSSGLRIFPLPGGAGAAYSLTF
jgi:tetratricopeptide (TPR) repeat protein